MHLMEWDGIPPDSLVDMLKMSFVWESWTTIIEISDHLLQITTDLCETSNLSVFSERAHLKRDIVYYVGYSLLMKGTALQKLLRYSEARQCISSYADLDWIPDLSTKGREEVERYRQFALANGYVIDLLEGERKVLSDYVNLVRHWNREETVAGLVTIQNQHTEAVDSLLDHMACCDIMGDGKGFRKSVAFYEQIREYATAQQRQSYHSILMPQADVNMHTEIRAIVH